MDAEKGGGWEEKKEENEKKNEKKLGMCCDGKALASMCEGR